MSLADWPTDTQILQFALTLENLENAFYSEGINKFNESDFESAGFSSTIRQRFLQITEHERTHVEFIQGALGSAAPQPCNYSL